MVSTQVNMGLFPPHSFVVASYGFNIGKRRPFLFLLLCNYKAMVSTQINASPLPPLPLHSLK
jgi:hypothetical protein